MFFRPFGYFFPDLAAAETRTLILVGGAKTGSDPEEIPDGEYGLLEHFCAEPACDCRRVMLYVCTPHDRKPLAVIAYGWEDAAFYRRWLGNDDPTIVRMLRGPVLNPGSPAAPFAHELLELVQTLVLRDRAYVERLARHYRMFKSALAADAAAPSGGRPGAAKAQRDKERRAKRFAKQKARQKAIARKRR